MDSAASQGLPLWARLKQPVFLAYLLVLCALAQRAWLQPAWEWDLLAYVGSVEELGGAGPEALHQAVYSELDRVAPKEVAADLRGSIAYREQLAADPAAFNAQLPFYRGRVLYIGLLAGLDQLGLPPIRGAFVLSLLAGLAFGVLLGLWLMNYLPPSLAVLAGLFVMTFGGVTDVMAMGTPDMLAATLLLASVCSLIECERRALGLGLLLLALATRADHVLLAAPLLVWLALRPTAVLANAAKFQLGGALALCMAVVWFCTAGRETYSWWVVFHHTFVQYKAFPATQTPAPDLLFAVERSLHSLPMFKALKPFCFSLMALLAVLWGWRKSGASSLGAGLGAVSLSSALVHFALFPALWPRLMLVYWTLGLLALCMVARERAQPRASAGST